MNHGRSTPKRFNHSQAGNAFKNKAADNRCPVSNNLNRTSSNQPPETNIQYPTPSILYQITRNPQLDIRGQKTDDRIQIADAGNQNAWIVHSRNSFGPPAPSIERCVTLCANPFAQCPFCPQRATRSAQHAARNAQPTTHNPQPATHNPQPATRNPQPATRNSYTLFSFS